MSKLPSYLAAAQPIPRESRAPWYKTIMPAYLGVMLWFVFWQDIVTAGMHPCPPAGTLSLSFFWAFVGLILAAVICHFLFYMAPGMLGMSTGLPLYVVGTSTYGSAGGLFMPGFLMGLLQFGWLAVNAYMVAEILCECFQLDKSIPGWPHGVIAALFAILAAIVGLKGIKYVGRVGTYLPIIPIIILVVLLVATHGGLLAKKDSDFLFPSDQKGQNAEQAAPVDNQQTNDAKPKYVDEKLSKFNTPWQIIGIMCIYVVGFFATAGAAGADIAMGSRSKEDVHIGGVTGIVLPTVLAGGAAMFIVVGAYGAGMVTGPEMGQYNPVKLMPSILGDTWANVFKIALAVSAFPGACFASFIAANSFKTTMPKVNPFVSVGIGTAVAIVLAVTGVVGEIISVFVVIGASFGPVCGAMLADFLMSGRKWSGPRAGFNPAGWISWIVGFAVGAFNLVVGYIPSMAAYEGYVPVPPITAFVVGFALYVLLSVMGLRTKKLEMPQLEE